MSQPIQSRDYRPNPEFCCEACVFGRGPHAEWCEKQKHAAETRKKMRAAAKKLNDDFSPEFR